MRTCLKQRREHGRRRTTKRGITWRENIAKEGTSLPKEIKYTGNRWKQQRKESYTVVMLNKKPDIYTWLHSEKHTDISSVAG